VVCALAIGGAIAAYIVTEGGHHSTSHASATGPLAPIHVTRPNVPIIGGGVPVDVDPLIERKDFGTTLTFLPGTHRYRLTVSNISSLGVIHSFQWYPPTATHIVKLLGSTGNACSLQGLKGFGGNQFPTLVLHQNVLCDGLDMKPPSCLCRGDGGAVTISFATDMEYLAGDVDVRVRDASLVFDRIPVR
jgi:hypothetical protein